MHIGIITPPVSGHLQPFAALGRELIERGHRVTVFHLADLGPRVREEGLEFWPIGATDHPEGSLALSLTGLAKLQGFAALRYTIEAVRKTTEMMCRDAPEAIRAAGIDCLLVDQTEPAGGSIAEHVGIPFVTVCNALLLTEESDVPPPFTKWEYNASVFSRARNWLGYRTSERVTKPVAQAVQKYRAEWSLPLYAHAAEAYSKSCQISQQPEAFDFPRRKLPKCFHYVGPLRREGGRRAPDFPWDRLNGKPLVYASLGTLQNRREQLFRLFSDACAGLPVQLVITHGGGLSPEVARSFPEDVVVVPYAPQLEVLKKATITLTHAGLNTVLDALSCGVPLVAIPITYEQPAIASRIRWTGVGETVEMGRITKLSLRRVLKKVLDGTNYKNRANLLKTSILASGGVKSAVKLIETTHVNA